MSLDLAALAALVWLVIVVVRRIRADGLGRRPGPRSHEPWHAGTRLEDLRGAA